MDDWEAALGCMVGAADERSLVGTLVGEAERFSLGCVVGENVGGKVADLSCCVVVAAVKKSPVGAFVGELEDATGFEVGAVDSSCAVGASVFAEEVNVALDSLVGVVVVATVDGRKEGACVKNVPAEGEVRVGCGMLEDEVA